MMVSRKETHLLAESQSSREVKSLEDQDEDMIGGTDEASDLRRIESFLRRHAHRAVSRVKYHFDRQVISQCSAESVLQIRTRATTVPQRGAIVVVSIEEMQGDSERNVQHDMKRSVCHETMAMRT